LTDTAAAGTVTARQDVRRQCRRGWAVARPTLADRPLLPRCARTGSGRLVGGDDAQASMNPGAVIRLAVKTA